MDAKVTKIEDFRLIITFTDIAVISDINYLNFNKKMKWISNLCLFLGILFILYNIGIDIRDINTFHFDTSENTGYFIGYQLFIVVGVILLRVAYRQQKKLNKIKRSEEEELINKIGSNK
jgi:hypothetical protein